MKLQALFLLTLAVSLLSASVRAALCQESDVEAAQERREEALAELLTGARLTGWFTDDTRPGEPPAQDSYVIARAEKADGKLWLIEAFVGETELTVPLFVPVEWAGDTPVLTLDHLQVPQMGTFDARVLFHGASYAGVWRGERHGGEMAGRIERAPAPSDEK